ncbi:MAG TPA: GDP-mannose 4,6-dehydratase [Ktedonobacterales bacterium]
MDRSAVERILITGSSGFVGSYLAAACHTQYPQATLFGLSLNVPGLPEAPGAVPLISLEADLLDGAQVRQAVARSRPDLLFHLAAQSSVAASWREPARTLQINAGGAIHLFEALHAEHLAPRVVLVGSGEQYGPVAPEENPIKEDCQPQPANPYAVSKVAQDLYGYQYFAAYGLPIIRARPFNHFGPRQKEAFVIANFARQIALIEAGRAEPLLPVGNLGARRDFLPVQDVVRAYLALVEQGHPGEAYNIGSGVARSIEEVLAACLELTDAPITTRLDPARLRPADVPLLVADTARLRAHTGWQPTLDFKAALQETLDYWRAVVRSEQVASSG